MTEHVHHVHLFTRDIDATVAWWRDTLAGVVAYDGDFGGSRKVFMHVGEGRLHFYDQRSRSEGEQLDPALADYFLGPCWRYRSE